MVTLLDRRSPPCGRRRCSAGRDGLRWRSSSARSRRRRSATSPSRPTCAGRSWPRTCCFRWSLLAGAVVLALEASARAPAGPSRSCRLSSAAWGSLAAAACLVLLFSGTLATAGRAALGRRRRARRPALAAPAARVTSTRSRSASSGSRSSSCSATSPRVGEQWPRALQAGPGGARGAARADGARRDPVPDTPALGARAGARRLRRGGLGMRWSPSSRSCGGRRRLSCKAARRLR